MPRQTKLSTCRRKIRFKDEESARGFASGVVRRQAPYRCNKCLQWHLTSSPRFRRTVGTEGLREGAEVAENAPVPIAAACETS
jgi:hypothetical protein